MILLKQQKLHFQDQKSDKIYEVDLYQVQEGEYIVNFRYGRRGKALKEGTKTVFPVPLEKAEKIFKDLASSKTKKGYREISQGVSNLGTGTGVSDTESIIASTVQKYLKQAANGEELSTNWKLSRIIWRAGELKREKCMDAIEILLPKLEGQEKYAAIWYLGRLANPSTYRILKSLDVKKKDLWYRIYTAAMIKCEDQTTIHQTIESLPPALKKHYTSNDFEAYFSEIEQYLFEIKSKPFSFLLSTYYLTIINEQLKPDFLNVLSRIPHKPGYWKYIRYIYKVAEMIDDEETYGLIAVRIQQSRPFFSPGYWNSVYVNGEYIDVADELKKEGSVLAFSNKTRDYFERRSMRRFKRVADQGQASYCALATAILVSYTEKDRIQHPPTYDYVYDNTAERYNRIEQHYHSLGHLPYIYYILYKRSLRLKMGYDKFYFIDEQTDQVIREEAHPELWDQYPEYAIQLLIKGRLAEVADFALLVLKDRSDLSDLIDISTVPQLLKSPFPKVIDFSLEIIRKKYVPHQVDIELIIILINTKYVKAIELALELIQKNPLPFVSNVAFVLTAIMTDYKELHDWLRENIKESRFSEEQQQGIIDHTFQSFFQLKEAQVLSQTVDTLIHCFKTNLSKLDISYLISLMDSDSIQLHLLAGKLINISQLPVPEDVILKMIASLNEEVREQGVDLLSKMTDQALLTKQDFIINLAIGSQLDLRLWAKDMIGRLAAIDVKFRDGVFLQLYPILLEKQEMEGLQQDVFTIISTHLAAALSLLMPEIESILKSEHREAHLMTAQFLDQYVDLNAWPIDWIALMGNHDMKYIRDMACQYYQNHIDRIKYEKETALKILDSDWETTRTFGFQYFESIFSEKEWNSDLIIALCDNVRPEIQQFGTRILGKYFKDEHGIKYLKALSEHPDAVLQLYVTNYLNKYAFNNRELLEELAAYFRTILMAINKNRVAKERVYDFLSRQAQEGEFYGKYVAGIINDVVGTIAVTYKEKCILLLYNIKKMYPNIDAKVEIVAVGTHS